MAGAISVALTTAGNPYRILDVIRGVQTTGVTLQTGAKVQPSASPNTARLVVQADSTNGAKLVRICDSSVTTTNGIVLTATSAPFVYMGEGSNRHISMANKWVAVDTNATIVNFQWE